VGGDRTFGEGDPRHRIGERHDAQAGGLVDRAAMYGNGAAPIPLRELWVEQSKGNIIPRVH
jgi:hypothetical protein